MATKPELEHVASVWTRIKELRRSDLECLAPRMATSVVAFLSDANHDGLDAICFETCRSDELQAIYYSQGTTRARTARYSWHFFGLAVDVISKAKGWQQPESWWRKLASIGKRHGLDWGGDWADADLPHFQFGTLKPTPSDKARQLFDKHGLAAVWSAAGALGPGRL